MLLQERHLVAYRQHVGGPASPSSIDRLFAELKGDGVELSTVPPGPEGGQPARAVDSARLADHLGVSEGALLRWVGAER